MLRLDARFHDVERRGEYTCHTACRRARENFERKSDVAAADVRSRELLLLLPEGELQGGEREIAEESSFVAVEERGPALEADDVADRVRGVAVVVTGVEVRIVVAALELQACFEDFRGDVER